MEQDSLAIFREYLRSLPDELLESVTEDYVWLASQPLDYGDHFPDFLPRRECCREECQRRGASYLYQHAERTVSPRAA